MKIILMFGSPGAGKGTQSKKIINKYGYNHISTGEILRTAIAENTPLGIEAAKYMDGGNLVPDDLVTRMIEEQIDKYPNSTGFVFDGFPRTVGQAEAFDKMLEKKNMAVSVMFALDVDKEILKTRLEKRAREEGRLDDTPEIIEKRIQIYLDKTAPVADYYKKQDKYHQLNGMGTIDEIFSQITRIIDNE